MSAEKKIISLKELSDAEHKKLIENIARGMYNSGSNNRGNKQGNPDRLVQKTLQHKSEGKPALLGVFRALMNNDDRDKVDDKKKHDGMTQDELKSWVKRYYLDIANTAVAGSYYCYVPSAVLHKLQAFVKGTVEDNKKDNSLQCALKIRSIILDQERKKTLGK